MSHRHLSLVLLCAALLAASAAPLFAAVVDETKPRLVANETDAVWLQRGEQLVGTIVETRDNGDLMFQALGKPNPFLITKDSYQRIVPKQTAAQAVENCGKWAIAHNDVNWLRVIIEWGVNNKAADAALALASKFMEANPNDTDIGELTIALLKAQEQWAKIEPVARGLLKGTPTFEAGYEALAEALLKDPGRKNDLWDLLLVWKDKRPTSQMGNRLLAQLAEERGELRLAQEAYRKLFDLHKDMVAAAGYARCCLKLGDYTNALRASKALLDGEQTDPVKAVANEARAIAGSAQVGLGDFAAAQELLKAAIAGELSPEMGEIAHHNLGVAYWRAGQADLAREQWKGINKPVSNLALAIADHKPFMQVDDLPSDTVKAVATELNACLDIEAMRWDKALKSINPKASKRHQFLADAAQVGKSNGEGGAIHAVALTSGVESLRWQVYGLLLASKYADAEKLLKELPENDGYAAVYRVYVAEGRKDKARATELYKFAAANAVNPPKDYMAKLDAAYQAENDEWIVEDFNWPEGDALATGWQVQTLGTAIRIHAEKGLLVLEGTQTASQDPVSRAWRMIAAEKLRAVEATLDISGIATADFGLELLDDKRENGVACSIRNDNKLGWRAMTNKVWGKWEALDIQVQGTQPRLRLEYNGGRVFAVPLDNLGQRLALGNAVLNSPLLCVSVFGTSEPGVKWRCAIDQLKLQMMTPGAAPAGSRIDRR